MYVNVVFSILPTTLLVGAFMLAPSPFIVTVYPLVKSTIHVVGALPFVSITVFVSSSQYPSLPPVHSTLFIMYSSLLGISFVSSPFMLYFIVIIFPTEYILYGSLLVPLPVTFMSFLKYILGLIPDVVNSFVSSIPPGVMLSISFSFIV